MSYKELSVFLLIIIITCSAEQIKLKENNLGHRTMMEFTKADGYPLEAHKMMSSDGYILTTYRIPHGRNSSRKYNYPVIIMHGLGSSSENFIVLGPGRALAYYLADNGYDVWLMNTRGNRHSRKHKTMNPDTDQEFWKFSLHEIGMYDIPVNIDYVLNATNSQKVIFIGYSQGSTVFFITVTEKPEYNDKILVSAHMAPSVLRRHLKETFPPLYSIVQSHKELKELLQTLNLHELFPNNEIFREVVRGICGLIKDLCGLFADLIGGTASPLSERERISEVLKFVPSGASSMQAIHYMQNMASGNYSQYDYGPEENMKKYNSTIPPQYNLSKATAPVILLYGKHDWWTENEMEDLKKELPNVYWAYEIPDENFNHADFILAKNAVSILYDPLLKKLQSLS